MVVPVGILFRETNRDFGGSRMRRVAGGLNDQPHDDHDSGEAEELETQLEGKCKQISPYVLKYIKKLLYIYTYIKPNKMSYQI